MLTNRLTSRVARGLLATAVIAGVASRAVAQPELPPVTDADRAAAFPDVGGHSHGMLEDPFNHSVRIDELESQQDGDDVLAWKAHAWIGHSIDKLAIRTEG